MSDYIMGCRNGRDEYISELIRCRDCKHYDYENGERWSFCRILECDTPETGFCYMAERKEE